MLHAQQHALQHSTLAAERPHLLLPMIQRPCHGSVLHPEHRQLKYRPLRRKQADLRAPVIES